MQPLADALAQPHDWAVFTALRACTQRCRRSARSAATCARSTACALRRSAAAHADALAAYGLAADLVPGQYDGAHLADALLAAMPQGGAALLLRAAAGGRILPEKLAAAGVTVTDVPLYDTVYRCAKADELRALLDRGEADVVTFTSMSTVEGFVHGRGRGGLHRVYRPVHRRTDRTGCPQVSYERQNCRKRTIDAMIACLLEES